MGARSRRPPAAELTPEIELQVAQAEIRDLEAQVHQYRSVAATVANIALCFAQMLVDHGAQQAGDRTVVVPRWLADRMEGATITVHTSDVIPGVKGDIAVTIRERAGNHKFDVE